jgi:hypothetical protein
MFSTTPITRWLSIEAMVPGPLGDLGRGALRRGHHQHLGVRQLLAEGDRDVTGAGGRSSSR